VIGESGSPRDTRRALAQWRVRRDSNSSTKVFKYQEVFVTISSKGQVEGQGGVVFGFDMLGRNSRATGNQRFKSYRYGYFHHKLTSGLTVGMGSYFRGNAGTARETCQPGRRDESRPECLAVQEQASEGAEGRVDPVHRGSLRPSMAILRAFCGLATQRASLDEGNCTELATPRSSGGALDHPERSISTAIASRQPSIGRVLDCIWH
jgi:hypothetical protein